MPPRQTMDVAIEGKSTKNRGCTGLHAGRLKLKLNCPIIQQFRNQTALPNTAKEQPLFESYSNTTNCSIEMIFNWLPLFLLLLFRKLASLGIFSSSKLQNKIRCKNSLKCEIELGCRRPTQTVADMDSHQIF